MNDLTRRTLLTAAAGAAMSRAPRAAAAGKPAAAVESPAASYRAVALRLPIEVPTSAAALDATRQRNAAAMVAAIDAAMTGPGPKPRLLVFPVLQYTSSRRAVSGVPMSAVAVDLLSEPLEKTLFAPVVAACRRHQCYVATSTQEKIPQFPGLWFHTGFVVGPEGLVLRSPKAQAQSAPEVSYLRDIAADYRRVFGPDSIMPVADTPLGRLACLVEGELEVLEAARLLASKGAQVILHTSLEDGDVPWLALKQAVGFQCHLYLVTGTTSRFRQATQKRDEWCGGASTIIGPDGAVLASRGGRDEGAAVADIDLTKITAAQRRFGRNTTPAWALYKDLYSPR
jgi:predicted amidohydrolase